MAGRSDVTFARVAPASFPAAITTTAPDREARWMAASSAAPLDGRSEDASARLRFTT
ncbi:MAG: hypothetical protein AVDCRST_MAG76-2736 [uncultured Acidimicrobiales bacterium]|uniref:Uncharacterized protein n=1 Tax=uncultured Acidimicrobiales bacterium TaxID=310071 RepID=A0A6J4ITG7_9ACTN|nr:MAG: hypothetical protein AVDCRST_MAG76-2736 [uncultured Acidimicrobiales bacterium]